MKKVMVAVTNRNEVGMQVFVCEHVVEREDRLLMTDIASVHGMQYSRTTPDVNRRGCIVIQNVAWYTVEDATEEDVPSPDVKGNLETEKGDED